MADSGRGTNPNVAFCEDSARTVVDSGTESRLGMVLVLANELRLDFEE